MGKPPFFAAGVVRRNQLARTDGRIVEVYSGINATFILMDGDSILLGWMDNLVSMRMNLAILIPWQTYSVSCFTYISSS